MKVIACGTENRFSRYVYKERLVNKKILCNHKKVFEKQYVKISINNEKSSMPWDEFEGLLKSLKFSRVGKTVQIILEGEEPLEHPCFLEMIKKCEALGMAIILKTNAVHIDLSLIQEIEKIIGLEYILIAVEATSVLPLDKIKLMKAAGIKVKYQHEIKNFQ